MRKALFALLLAILVPVASAQKAEVNPADASQAITITLEPLGENEQGQTVARISFRFATPPEVPEESGLFLQGSILQDGKVLRNFRIAVPLELQRPLTTIQAFAEGPAEVEARLILPMEEGMPAIVTKATASFTVAKANQPYVASEDDGAEAILAEGVIPEVTGAVKIRAPKRDVAPNLFIVNVDVQPPVKRVEFWVEGKKVLARNAPPYSAELDLGTIPKRVEVRVVGYDAQGRYIDADAFIVNERETPLEVKITRTQTPDGVSHFKLSIQNPKNTAIQTVILYAGANKLYEWKRPPYALSVANARLANEEFVRASVIDDTGYEAADLLFLNGDRYIEEIEVNLVELPVSVNDAAGNPITGPPANEDEARTLFTKLDAADTQQNFIKVFDYLKTRKDANGNYGCVGFCWGGAMANQLAVKVPELKAAVAFYGRQPDAADVPKIKAAVQLHYGGLDERINTGIAAYEEALKKAGVKYEVYIYEGANHAFHNDTAPTRYNKEAAELAWGRTIKFFGISLK